MAQNKAKRNIVSRSLLKREGVKVQRERGKFVFVIPADKANKIQEEYGFSFDMLSVGGEIPLAELAVHIDEQAANEGRIGLVCELSRYALENEKANFEDWYSGLFYKCRTHLQSTTNEKSPTEATVKGYIITKHGKEYQKRQQKIRDLELQYRLLNNVFRAALTVKGELLPSLRNIVQGKADGIGSISVKTQKKEREMLKVKV